MLSSQHKKPEPIVLWVVVFSCAGPINHVR